MLDNHASYRVRFAPSPTGFLHVGGLRTALFNVLLARKHQGKAILRIEDTDQERTVPGAEEHLRDILTWAGLTFDESPWIGGEFGPYRQSERLSLYQGYAQKLLDNGNAYRCFCRPEESEQRRAKQVSRGEDLGYDGRCRRLTSDEIENNLAKGLPYIIRQKLPQDQTVTFNDMIRGEISFHTKELDDQVLLKSDGFPTYHLAHVVDDHLMKITIVLRGEEWISSAPKHILLFEAFGWEPPRFAHLPLILDANRQKLSKRSGDVSAFVEEFRDQGVLPEALVNYIALLGWHPEGDEEVFDFEKLVELFDLDRVGKAGAVFDSTKLFHLNGVYIRNLPDSQYISIARKQLINAGVATSGVSEETIDQMLIMIRDRISRFSEIPQMIQPILSDQVEYEADAMQVMTVPGTKELIVEIAEVLSDTSEFNGAVFKDAIKEVGKRLSRKGPDLWMPVRVALTGRLHGPDLHRIAEILGKESSVKRLRTAAEAIGG
jgi:nondiscriminating glutamyl-tRNA synthetase